MHIPSRGSYNRFLLVSAVLSATALLVAVAGLVVDHHVITGAPAWLKPAKFAISISLYCATVAWLIGLVSNHSRLRQVIACATGGALLGELALIDLQVLRGTSSHFNTATSFDANIFGVMGALVAVVFVSAVVLACVLARQPLLPKVLKTGVIGGLAVCLLGMAQALLMIHNQAHTVGAHDANAGSAMWFTDWSLQHGDLRVAHFVGLHGLQVLPALAWALTRFASRDESANQNATSSSRIVLITSLYYGGLVILLSWQAELGRPLPHPGPVVGAVAIAWTLAAIGAVAIAWRTRPQPKSGVACP